MTREYIHPVPDPIVQAAMRVMGCAPDHFAGYYCGVDGHSILVTEDSLFDKAGDRRPAHWQTRGCEYAIATVDAVTDLIRAEAFRDAANYMDNNPTLETEDAIDIARADLRAAALQMERQAAERVSS